MIILLERRDVNFYFRVKVVGCENTGKAKKITLTTHSFF